MPDRTANFRDEFWLDVLEASSWYEEQEPGLGEAFERAIVNTVELVLLYPLGFRLIRPELRRASVKRFRHSVIYAVLPDRIHFVGVVHGMRDLPRWLSRRLEDE